MVATASCSSFSSRDTPSRSSSRSTGIGVMNTRASTCNACGMKNKILQVRVDIEQEQEVKEAG